MGPPMETQGLDKARESQEGVIREENKLRGKKRQEFRKPSKQDRKGGRQESSSESEPGRSTGVRNKFRIPAGKNRTLFDLVTFSVVHSSMESPM